MNWLVDSQIMAGVKPDARLAAWAAIRAGEIEAAATRLAGYLTLAAGALAIVAAGVGATATLWAAQKSNRLAEHQQLARAKAYYRHLLMKMDPVSGELSTCWNLCKSFGPRQGKFDPEEHLKATRDLLAEIAPDAWERLLPLGNLLPLVDELHRAVSRARFQISASHQLYKDMPTGEGFDAAHKSADTKAEKAVEAAKSVLKRCEEQLRAP